MTERHDENADPQAPAPKNGSPFDAKGGSPPDEINLGTPFYLRHGFNVIADNLALSCFPIPEVIHA